MTGRSAALAILAAASLAACAPEAPNAYSPGYSRIAVAEGGSADGKVRKGYDRTAGYRRTALVPDACITPDTAPDPQYLPSGCANALNLQQMVEREGDLERGQRPGPAMAAPVARAARNYIDGKNEDERRRRIEGDDPNTHDRVVSDYGQSQGTSTTAPAQ